MKELTDPYIVVAKALKAQRDTLNIDSKMYEHPNWDSVTNVAVISEIEHSYEIIIDDLDIMKYNNMKSIVSLYEGLKSSNR